MLQQQQQQQQQQQHQQQQQRRIHFPPAQVSKVINDIQQQNPGLSKDQVTKLAAQYLASLLQQGYGVPSSPVPPHQKSNCIAHVRVAKQRVSSVYRKKPNFFGNSSLFSLTNVRQRP